MKTLITKIAFLFIAIATFTSCDQSLTEEIIATEGSSELTTEEINSAVETLAFKYSITALGDDGSQEVISNDTELTSYNKKTRKPRIVFPIDVTVDGETVTINSKEEMKTLVGKKKRKHRRPPFQLVYPISVNTTNGELSIEDKEGFKAYRESLEKGTHPDFVFPISVIFKGETIVINSEEELKALKPEKREKPARPELVFPISVVTEDGNLEIADKEALKAYKETLEEGTRPELVFPVSILVNEETVVVNNEDELKEFFKRKGPKANKPRHPKFVFPVSVVTADGNLEIADKEAMKAYVETLEKGTHPELVFPVSVIVKDETIVVNSQEELKALKPKKGRRK